MASVTFRLDLRSKAAVRRRLYADISTSAGRFKHYPGIELDPATWSDEHQRVSLPKHPADARKLNDELEAVRTRISAYWLQSRGNKAAFKSLLKTGEAGEALDPLSLQAAIDRRLADKAISDSKSTTWAYGQLRSVIDKLTGQVPLPLAEFNYAFYARLRQHLVLDQGLANSSANALLGKLRTTLTHVATRHADSLDELTAARLLTLVPRLDALPDEEPDIFVPTLPEVLHLAGLLLDEHPELRLTRDRFIFACFTGPRHSDLNTLENINLLEGPGGEYLLRYLPIKTKRRSFVQVPVNKFAYELLCRALADDANRADSSGLLLDYVDNRRENERLHCLLRDHCGGLFHDQVQKVTFKRGRRLVTTPARWEAITFHSSRHFFAITLISLGVPPQHVQDLMGHANLTSTMRYAKIASAATTEAASTALAQLNLPSLSYALPAPADRPAPE